MLSALARVRGPHVRAHALKKGKMHPGALLLTLVPPLDQQMEARIDTGMYLSHLVTLSFSLYLSSLSVRLFVCLSVCLYYCNVCVTDNSSQFVSCVSLFPKSPQVALHIFTCAHTVTHS